MATIDINGDIYNYTIRRQKRKSIQLHIVAANTLLIKAPVKVLLRDILSLLKTNAFWLKKKNTLLQKQVISTPVAIVNGTKVLFKGTALTLQLTQTLCKPSVTYTSTCLLVNLYKDSSYTPTIFLLKWYQSQAYIHLIKRTTFWCNELGTTVNHITIKDQKTRWGSCSSLGNINYNWRIIMAPESVIDYLVIHEVSHRIHLNHSTAFWQLVQKHSPQYIEHKIWLKKHGPYMFQIL